MAGKFISGAFLLALAARPAFADDCALANAAMLKGFQTPANVKELTGSGGLIALGDVQIIIGGKRYVKSIGVTGPQNWDVFPFDPAKHATAYREQMKGRICHSGGTETIDGQIADIVVWDAEGKGRHYNNRLWISRALGLPVKHVVLSDSGTETTWTFEYKNVRAPALP